MRKHAGTTLLEAIVALTVMAAGAMALFAWMGTNARAFDRVAAQVERLSMERSGLAVIEAINPMAEPNGRREIAGLVVAWRARPVTATTPGRGPGGPMTVFDVSLYDLDVEVSELDGDRSRFTVRKLGWVTARSFEPEP